MSKKIFTLVILTIYSLLAASCSAQPAEQAAPEADQASRSSNSALPNLLVLAEGKVELRRSGWEDFIPIGFGTLVSPGDLVRVDGQSAGAVFCGAEGEWTQGEKSLPADGAEHGIPCKTGRPPRPWADVVALRGAAVSESLYVISPRATALTNDRPQLEWHAPDGEATYTVSLVGDDGKERAPLQVKGSSSAWPQSWTPLQAEAGYILVVESAELSSNSDPEANVGAGFRLLPKAEVETILERETQLRASGVSPQAADLLVAELYRQNGLRAEAIQLYQALAAGQSSPAVWLVLGQTYLEIGLSKEAGQAFEQALAAAQAAGQREAEAAALFGSGMAYHLMQDEPASLDALQSARQIYEQIGDQDGLAQLEKLLSK